MTFVKNGARAKRYLLDFLASRLRIRLSDSSEIPSMEAIMYWGRRTCRRQTPVTRGPTTSIAKAELEVKSPVVAPVASSYIAGDS